MEFEQTRVFSEALQKVRGAIVEERLQGAMAAYEDRA
jgi:hypothetical protein